MSSYYQNDYAIHKISYCMKQTVLLFKSDTK